MSRMLLRFRFLQSREQRKQKQKRCAQAARWMRASPSASTVGGSWSFNLTFWYHVA